MFAALCVATAAFSGAALEVVIADETLRASKDFKKLNSTGVLPLLETADGSIGETLAICKYLARVGPEGTGLLGTTPLEKT